MTDVLRREAGIGLGTVTAIDLRAFAETLPDLAVPAIVSGAHCDAHPARDRILGAVRSAGTGIFRTAPISAMPVEYLTRRSNAERWMRSSESPTRANIERRRVPDLLIAAAAEYAGPAALRVSKDFELIASFTGQSVERLTS